MDAWVNDNLIMKMRNRGNGFVELTGYPIVLGNVERSQGHTHTLKSHKYIGGT